MDPTGYACDSKGESLAGRRNNVTPNPQGNNIQLYNNTQNQPVALNPNNIRYSQSSVNGASEIISSMQQRGWDGVPIDVVIMPDGNLTSIDNTRVLSARTAGIDVMANIHSYNELLPSPELVNRFTNRHGVPQTWGDAISLRIRNQNSGYRTQNPLGSNITGWSGN